jgi:hypothetical protein
MPTLYLSAPKDKDTASALHRDFNTIRASSVGPEYAIARKWLMQIMPGMKVVVFNRADRKQAEGNVAAVSPTGQQTAQGLLRYNVIIRDLADVSYNHPPQVDRFGVSVI